MQDSLSNPTEFVKDLAGNLIDKPTKSGQTLYGERYQEGYGYLKRVAIIFPWQKINEYNKTFNGIIPSKFSQAVWKLGKAINITTNSRLDIYPMAKVYIESKAYKIYDNTYIDVLKLDFVMHYELISNMNKVSECNMPIDETFSGMAIYLRPTGVYVSSNTNYQDVYQKFEDRNIKKYDDNTINVKIISPVLGYITNQLYTMPNNSSEYKELDLYNRDFNRYLFSKKNTFIKEPQTNTQSEEPNTQSNIQSDETLTSSVGYPETIKAFKKATVEGYKPAPQDSKIKINEDILWSGLALEWIHNAEAEIGRKMTTKERLEYAEQFNATHKGHRHPNNAGGHSVTGKKHLDTQYAELYLNGEMTLEDFLQYKHDYRVASRWNLAHPVSAPRDYPMLPTKENKQLKKNQDTWYTQIREQRDKAKQAEAARHAALGTMSKDINGNVIQYESETEKRLGSTFAKNMAEMAEDYKRQQIMTTEQRNNMDYYTKFANGRYVNYQNNNYLSPEVRQRRAEKQQERKDRNNRGFFGRMMTVFPDESYYTDDSIPSGAEKKRNKKAGRDANYVEDSTGSYNERKAKERREEGIKYAKEANKYEWGDYRRNALIAKAQMLGVNPEDYTLSERFKRFLDGKGKD